MGDFTSEYRDQDGRVTTRVDPVKSIDSFATIITWLLFGVFILLWKILKCINSSDCKKGRYFLLSLFTGGLGFNNFYAKQYIMGFIKLGIMGIILFMASGVLVDKKTAEHMVTLILPALLFLTLFSLFEAIYYSLDNSSTTPSKKAPSIFLALFLSPFHKLYQKNYLAFVIRFLPIPLFFILDLIKPENLFGLATSGLFNQQVTVSLLFLIVVFQVVSFIEVIIYIFTSHEKFQEKYIKNKKFWF